MQGHQILRWKGVLPLPGVFLLAKNMPRAISPALLDPGKTGIRVYIPQMGYAARKLSVPYV
jgi:SpoVK/Ycf46/Vps4 family AAA+-type ATPase